MKHKINKKTNFKHFQSPNHYCN